MHRQEPCAFDAAEAADFLQASAEWPPRATLMSALTHLETRSASGFERPNGQRRAIDLGCGAGTETLELLRRGWLVDAIDLHQPCLDFTRRRAEGAGCAEGLRMSRCGFEDLSLPRRAFGLAHAGFSLPFCRADAFERAWLGITGAVIPGGCFAGQFFGHREPLVLAAVPGSAVSHDRESIQRLLGPADSPQWRIVNLDEVDRPGRGPRGEPKHWHVFHAVFERADDPPSAEVDGGSPVQA